MPSPLFSMCCFAKDATASLESGDWFLQQLCVDALTPCSLLSRRWFQCFVDLAEMLCSPTISSSRPGHFETNIGLTLPPTLVHGCSSISK